MIAPPDVLETERLRLRRPRESDAAAIFAYASDAEVTRFMDWPTLQSMDDARRGIERAVQRWESGEEYSWRITVVPDDTVVGSVGCQVAATHADLGFVLSRTYWNRGYATEAARAVFGWLASIESIRRIQATCDVDNHASIRVLEKLGMIRERLLPNAIRRPNLPNQEVRDALLYAWMRPARAPADGGD